MTNGHAPQLLRRTAKVIAMAFVSPPEDPLSEIEEDSLLFVDAVIRGAELAAQRYGYSLLLSGFGAGAPAGAMAELAGSADGVIVLGQALAGPRAAALARRSPLVLLAGSGRSQAAVNVRVDNVKGMQTMARHLVSHHGLRRFAFMAGRAESPDSTARQQAFNAMVSSLGGEVEHAEHGWSADWTSAGASRVVTARLASGQPVPEAIVCASDPMAIGVLQALVAAGINVPEEVKVTGFDDIPVARHTSPSLTTVRQPSQQLGAAGVEALVGLIEDRPHAQRDRVLPTQLVVRSSCGCPPPSPPAPGLLKH
jgi:LacI family transcriptional regulator